MFIDSKQIEMNSRMEAVLILPLSPTFKFSYCPFDLDEFGNFSGKFVDDSRKRLKINFRVNRKIEDGKLRNKAVVEEKEVDHGEKENKTEEKEEEEFSFGCMNTDVSLVSAEDVFVNGMIRPMFPVITNGCNSVSPLRPPLKKPFIQRPGICHSSLVSTKSEELYGAPEGSYSKWPRKLAVDASPEKCKKSKPTRFSKLKRFRELFHQSKSDGKDAFVFLNPPATGVSKKEDEKMNIKMEKTGSGKAKYGVVIKAKAPKGAKVKTTSPTYEKYYLMNRAKKESDKRSYLPYKLGFCTCVNGMSRSVHPF